MNHDKRLDRLGGDDTARCHFFRCEANDECHIDALWDRIETLGIGPEDGIFVVFNNGGYGALRKPRMMRQECIYHDPAPSQSKDTR